MEAVVVRFAGDSGDGMQLTGGQFTLSTALAGNDLATFPDFPAEIRAPQGTTFGVSAFQINFGSCAIDTAGDQPDVLIAMNPAALKVNVGELREGGLIIVDDGEFTARNLAKAGYEAKSARGRQPRQMAAGPLQHLAADARRGEAVRPRQQGGPALQEHVDAWPGAVDVRPRSRADRRLAQDQVRQGAGAGRIEYRRVECRPCLWRDGRDRHAGPPPPHRCGAGRARPVPHRHRRRGAGGRPGRGRAAGGAEDVLRLLSDHAGLAAAAPSGAAEGIRDHDLPGGGRDRGDLRGDRRVLCRAARRHLVVGTRDRAQDRGHRAGGDDRAAAGRGQFAARRAVDRPADQDRAVGSLPGGLWPQRRQRRCR